MFALGGAGLILALGIGWCLKISRRDTTSTKCALGLALVLAGMLPFFPIVMFEGKGWTALFFRNPQLMIFAMLGGMGLAGVGLAQYGSAQPPYEQGRKQGWAALLLVLGLVMFVVIGSG